MGPEKRHRQKKQQKMHQQKQPERKKSRNSNHPDAVDLKNQTRKQDPPSAERSQKTPGLQGNGSAKSGSQLFLKPKTVCEIIHDLTENVLALEKLVLATVAVAVLLFDLYVFLSGNLPHRDAPGPNDTNVLYPQQPRPLKAPEVRLKYVNSGSIAGSNLAQEEFDSLQPNATNVLQPPTDPSPRPPEPEEDQPSSLLV